MPHLSTKASHEHLKKQTETVQYLLTVLKSMDKNTGPPLYTLLHEKNINLSSVLETLIKSSDNEILRQRICDLGVLQVIADLLKQPIKSNDNASSVETRYHACTLLTNLSVGNLENKKLIISIDGLINGLLAQLKSSSEKLQRMAAGVLRNLSLNADELSKKVLKNSGIIPALLSSAMMAKEESTLECLLTALWNISGHSEENKKDICEFHGSLKFIVSLLVQENPSIVENGGGILKNVSSYITVHENPRQILRQNKCFEILLQHLRSQNSKIVSNACGTLWNLSARCAEDQRTLLDLGAVAILGQLVTSEHEAISMASSAALKNLVSFRMNNSSSNSFNPEFEKRESKRMMHHTSLNETHQVQLKAPQALGNLHPKMCDYEESLDELIDFSGRYKEFHEQPHIWQSKSSIEGVSSYSPFSCDHVISKRNHPMHKNFLMANSNTANKVPVKTNVGSIEVTGHLQDIFQACKQDFMPMSPPELLKHYCTEDTPDGHSMYHSSVINISDFTSMEIGHYQNIGSSQIPLAEKGLTANNPIYKESVSLSPKEIPREYCTEDTPEGFSRGSSLSSLSMKSLENMDQKKFLSERVVEQSVGLPCINENETLNITSNVSKSAVNKFKLCSQDGMYGAKAVTFDETPLMFSRSSSLASLNSFDAHSVHSSLISEYSRRASSVVSPSELPNSPGESPPSPQQPKMEVGHSYEGNKRKDNVDVKHQLSLYKTNEDKDGDCLLSDNEDENAAQLLCQVMRTAMPKDEKRSKAASRISTMNTNNLKHFYLKESPHPKPCFITPSADVANDASFSDTMKTYAVEGTPLELSRSASLSILTIDDSLIKKVGEKSGSYSHFMRFNTKRDDMDSCDDSVHAYCTERTPITFSRNESLSPLCSKESPAKLVDISFDVHPQSSFLMETSKPFQHMPSIATSTPSNKPMANIGEQVNYNTMPSESSSFVKDDVNSMSKSFKNLTKEFDAVSSSSSSSSFSCSSDELPSVDCFEIAEPKCKEGRKKSILAGLERKSCEGSSLNHTRDLSKIRNSKLEKSSFSEDEDTEVNNTVIYKGPQEVLLREEMSPIPKNSGGHCDLTELIEDFDQKTRIKNTVGNKYLVEQVQHLEEPQASLSIGNNVTSLAPTNATSSVLEKKNSKNRLTNFLLRYSMSKKKNPQKTSPSKDNKKFKLSIKKSYKSHHKKIAD